MWHDGKEWVWWIMFGSIWMVALSAVIAWALLLIGPRRDGRDSASDLDQGRSALDVLEARYARGELSDEQFERMRQRLIRPRDPSTMSP